MAKKSSSPSKPEKENSSQAGTHKKESYRVLARKYRPETFDDLIGQDALVQTLSNAFTSSRIAQAYMLTGVRGVGKTTTARLIARGLNYDTGNGEGGPSLDFSKEGVHCRAILESSHMDVLEMDAASNTGIDDVREIIESVRYAPVSSRYKVYIIDEVHMLSRQAFNGLLKTLEEPPPHVKFIFATTEIRKVPVTVLSRCQRFDLRRVGSDELFSHFSKIASAENVKIEDEALRAIIRASEGSVRDGLSLLDQAIAHGDGKVETGEVQNMLGLVDRSRIADLAEFIFKGDIKAALFEIKNQFDFGADPALVMSDLAEYVHSLTKAKIIGDDALGDFTGEEQNKIKTMAKKLSLRSLARAWQILLKGLEEVDMASNNMAAAEMVLIRLGHSADMPTPDELIRQIKEQGVPQTSGDVMPPTKESASSKDTQSAAATPQIAPSENVQEHATEASSPLQTENVSHALAVHQDERTHTQGTAPQLSTYAQIVSMARSKGDIPLCYELENNVRIVKFEFLHIEMSLEPNAKASLPNELSRKLEQWTGERWMVAVSKENGDATLAEQKAQEKQKMIDDVRAEPLVKATLEAFPGAEIIGVSDAIKLDFDE